MTDRSVLWAAGLSVLLALSAPAPSEGQVRLSLQWMNPVETLYLSDLAPYNVGQQSDFLSVTLLNGAQEQQAVVLELTVTREQPARALIFRGATDAFLLDLPPLRLTNRDLSSGGGDVSLSGYELGPEAEALAGQLNDSGRFPAGAYAFAVRVLTPRGFLLDEAELRLDLINATRVELLAPGAPFGDPPPIVTTPAPRFVWGTDAGIVREAGEYHLRVVAVDGAVSPDEAMQGYPVWETVTSATTALYPGSVSALPLEPGATYAWQVTRRVRTSGGREVLESPIHTFRMSGTSRTGGVLQRGSGALVGTERVVGELGRALGLGEDLDGFWPTGQVLMDGRPVQVDGLEALVRAVLAGNVAVHSVTVR